MITEPALIPAALFAVVGAVWDVRTRRIPNWLVALLALAAAGATLGMDGWSALGSSAIHAAIALVVGMGLFALRAIGAGDAKFYSAAALAVDGRITWIDHSLASLHVRELSDGFIENYLDAEWPAISYCAGAFRIEAMGPQLFDAIIGDQFTVLGMPLLQVLGALRERGVLIA